MNISSAPYVDPITRIAKLLRRKRGLPKWLQHHWKTPDFSTVTRQRRRREGFAKGFAEITKFYHEAPRKRRRVMSRIAFKRNYGAGTRRPGESGTADLFDTRGRYRGTSVAHYRRGNHYRRTLALLAYAQHKGWLTPVKAIAAAASTTIWRVCSGSINLADAKRHQQRYFPMLTR